MNLRFWKTDVAGCRFDSQSPESDPVCSLNVRSLCLCGYRFSSFLPQFQDLHLGWLETLKNCPYLWVQIVAFSISASPPQWHCLYPQTLWPFCRRPLFIWTFQLLFITSHALTLMHSLQHSRSAHPSPSKFFFFFSPGAQTVQQHWPPRLTVSFKTPWFGLSPAAQNINSALAWPWTEDTS